MAVTAARMLFRLRFQGRHEHRGSYSFWDGEVTIGRAPENTISVGETALSRRHARVFVRGGLAWLADMKSTSGTYLNGLAVHGEKELADGDGVRCGQVAFTFEVVQIPADEEPEMGWTGQDSDHDAIAGRAEDFIGRFLPDGVKSVSSLLSAEGQTCLVPSQEEIDRCLSEYAGLVQLAAQGERFALLHFGIMEASELTLAYLSRGRAAGRRIPRDASVTGVIRAKEPELRFFVERLTSGSGNDALKRLVAVADVLEAADELNMDLERLVGELRRSAGSDLLLRAGGPLQIVTLGGMRPLDAPAISAADLARVAEVVLDSARRQRLDGEGMVRAVYVSPLGDRFRAEFRRDQEGIEVAFRAIPTELPHLDKGGPGSHLARLAETRRGLILIGGPPGSGRSTVQARLLERVIQDRAAHVLTVEDPVEFIHATGRSLVTQREIGRDVPSVQAAVEAALRDLPDVVALGPLSNVSLIEASVQLAAAGALVLGTTNATTIAETRRQLLESFPVDRRPEMQRRIGAQLGGVYCQVPVPLASGDGWVPAAEVAFGEDDLRKVFAVGSDSAIYSAMSIRAEKVASTTRNQSLCSLYFGKRITREAALAASDQPDELLDMIRRADGLRPLARPPRRPL